MEEIEQEGEIKSYSAPRLNALEKLYVRVYLATHSHPRAHEAVVPGIKHPKNDNPYSSRENVQFHISLGLQQQAEAFQLTPEKIIERLYVEAVREGPGSNHAARIAALTQLGKHYGLFQDKQKDEKGFTFNIVNFSSPKAVNTISVDSIEQEKLEELPDNIEITDYSE